LAIAKNYWDRVPPCGVLHDAFAVRCPGIDAEGEVRSRCAHVRLFYANPPGLTLPMILAPIIGALRKFKKPSGVLITTAQPEAVACTGAADIAISRAATIATHWLMKMPCLMRSISFRNVV